ncbi:MAG: gamma carbonic anhydrase family protein [Clostridia bacterium]|nr:gamma carbonic anhydrase family protein [Clostridia bacterium]MBR2968840.1 gamma carbonic anhydrase family protein [Clostridia bacterium]
MNDIKIGKGVYINELAHVSGKVTLGDDVNLWPGASVRGDRSSITIGSGSNVQDNATVHSEAKTAAVIGCNVTIGHNAVVHGARIEDNVIIGMGAIVLDGAVIGSNTIVGAGAVIGGGKVIPAGSVVVGNPFKILREIREEEIKHIEENAKEYVRAAKEYAKLK